MENILVVGANTRPIACSLNKLGYGVYSADYFGCMDLEQCVKRYRSIISQLNGQSCGIFTKNFSSEALIGIAEEFYDLADKIIYNSGVNPSKLPKHKLIGNTDIEDVQNKYKLYKNLKKRFEGFFKLPDTYLVDDLKEANEIADTSPEKKFLLKPLEGSGGIGIKNLAEIDSYTEIHEAVLQEIVDGIDISTSVLSNGYEAKTLLASHQIIGSKNLGQYENYGYCGNISPFIYNTDQDHGNINNISEKIIEDLGLIGSNGIDMVIRNNQIYVIEVNPRIQGTFEVAEASLGINMIQAHIKACEGEPIDPVKPKKFAVKKVVFAKHRSSVGLLNLEGVHDIPRQNTIVEKGEPVCTVLKSGQILEDVMYSSENVINQVYGKLNKIL